MQRRRIDRDIADYFGTPGGRDTLYTFLDRPPLRRVYPQTTTDPDVPWLHAEIRRLRTENISLKQEVKWHADTILKAEAKSLQLLKELRNLKRYAERTELMSPQLTMVLVSLVCRLLESVETNLDRPVHELIPECLALVDQCPFVSLLDSLRMRYLLGGWDLPLLPLCRFWVLMCNHPTRHKLNETRYLNRKGFTCVASM